MVEALLGRLGARFVFVVGKGGVGKSTCAGAIALGLADQGEEVHLVSTDPAHSLGDLFEQLLTPGEPAGSACSPALVLEEVDAAARARAWLEDVREPVAQLVDLGTYLEGEDVSALLDRSMPGMDELMAALRLVELSEATGATRVVVDTAPTGHMLRMLEAGAVLEGWSEAFSAMAEKAAAVAVGLTRQRPRFAGEQVIDELRNQVTKLKDDVLAPADFVVVHREGDVVAAETRRLQEELARRGHHVRALVDVGGCSRIEASVPVFAVPWQDRVTGCEGLRSWGSARVEAGAPRPAPVAPRARGREVLAQLGKREAWLFVGKGGVGKSTCAAAFALALGEKNDVLLLGTDPAGSLADVLGVPVGRGETQVAPRVHARELDAEAELTEFRERYRARIRGVFERIGVSGTMPLDRRVLESFLEMAPSGVDEIFALDAMMEGALGRRTLVVDAAPTGHLLRLLEMPDVARSWVRGLLKILLEYRSVLALEDFAPQLLELARRLDALSELLRDPRRTGAVLVTLDERLPRLETERLARALAAAGTPPAAVVHNRWRGATATGPDLGAPAVLAPRLDPPPVGRERLLEFLEGWSLP